MVFNSDDKFKVEGRKTPAVAGSDKKPGMGPLIAGRPDPRRPLKLQIFEYLRAHGSLPRVKIARELEISPATVTTISSELIADGLIEETILSRRVDEASRGRPPVALRVRSDTHHVVGLRIADQAWSAVLMDFAGNSVTEAEGEIEPRFLGSSDIVEIAEMAINQLEKNSGISRNEITTLGIGLPGVIDHETGVVFWSPVMTERDIPLAAELNEALGVETVIDNDTNLLTLSELWFGGGRELANFAVVTIEQGVGMGVVIDHRLYRGAHGIGMELGHMKVQLDGALCRCGQRGCLEAYLADYALAREAATALERPGVAHQPPERMLESLFDHAKAGNHAAISIFRRAGRYLALGLANVINLFGPSVVILSGARMQYDYLYAPEAMSEMNRMALDVGPNRPPIAVHVWGDLVWAHGAAALALERLTERRLGTQQEGELFCAPTN